MEPVFSQRHKRALEKKKIQVSLPKVLRRKIVNCMKKHNYWYGYDHQDSIFHDDLRTDLQEAYGTEELKAYIEDNLKPVGDTEEFILNAWPAFVLDSVELYYHLVSKNGSIVDFVRELNSVFKSEKSPYRMLDQYVIKLDSAFLESEVLNRAYELLENNQFEKACKDFVSARDNFSAGDYCGTIFECNNTIESALKKATDTRSGNQKDLKRKLMKSGIIPEYFQGFCDYFEGFLQSCFTIANQSSRHGKKELPQPKDDVSQPVASFMIHITGSILLLIMERYEELNPKPVKSETFEVPDDDIPF
jgi:hypothetical protein